VTILVDTSALYALLDEDDANHRRAAARWPGVLDSPAVLTHAYVVIETSSLVLRRLGARAARQLHDGLLPAVRVRMVDESLHDRAIARWLSTERRSVSLVDVTSFELMDDLGIERAFAFDIAFECAGYNVVR
jgi:predicted nucleic acid-binding protein